MKGEKGEKGIDGRDGRDGKPGPPGLPGYTGKIFRHPTIIFCFVIPWLFYRQIKTKFYGTRSWTVLS